MRQIAFLTFAAMPDLSEDDRLALGPLHSEGFDAVPLPWDSPKANGSSFDALVLRSCWDYHLRAGEFLRALDAWQAQGARLWNPPALVRWNHCKTYLRDLEAQGVDLPPTVWLERGAEAGLLDSIEHRAWPRAVVKPFVSGGAHQTWLTSAADAPGHQARFEQLLREGGVLLQAFVEEITTAGEWSFVFFAGAFSHAVLKRPRAGDFRVQESLGGRSDPATPPASLLRHAERVAGLIPGPWLYARVDGVEAKGRLLLMELELIEPALFLGSDPAAPARFARAVRQTLGDGPSV